MVRLIPDVMYSLVDGSERWSEVLTSTEVVRQMTSNLDVG